MHLAARRCFELSFCSMSTKELKLKTAGNFNHVVLFRFWMIYYRLFGYDVWHKLLSRVKTVSRSWILCVKDFLWGFLIWGRVTERRIKSCWWPRGTRWVLCIWQAFVAVLKGTIYVLYAVDYVLNFMFYVSAAGNRVFRFFFSFSVRMLIVHERVSEGFLFFFVWFLFSFFGGYTLVCYADNIHLSLFFLLFTGQFYVMMTPPDVIQAGTQRTIAPRTQPYPAWVSTVLVVFWETTPALSENKWTACPVL